jgi:uncharacterized membrane protein YfcA
LDLFHSIPPGDLGVLALGLVIAGTVGGLAAGVLGIGGGIVVLPVLYHVMTELGVDASVRMHLAIGTTLAATIPAALLRARTHWAAIDWEFVRRWTAPLAAGAVVGIGLTAIAGEHLLAVVFAALALPVAIALAVDGGTRERSAQAPTGHFLLPAIVGGTSAITGMGADVAASPLLQWFGVSPERAVAAASVFALVVAVPGAFGAVLLGWNMPALPPASLGYVTLFAFALVAPVLVPAEIAGAALAHMVDLRRLRFVFAALVAIATARILWDAWA